MLIGTGSPVFNRTEEEKKYTLFFDGVDDYAVAAGFGPFNGSFSFTIEFWFRTLDISNVVRSAVARGSGWRFYAGYVRGLRGQIGSAVLSRTNLLSATNEWHHAAWVVSRDENGDGYFRCYLDGVQAGDDLILEGELGGPSGTGSIFIGSYGGGQYFYYGSLREIRLWDYPRSEEEINEDMGKIIYAAPGLIARWGLDEGGGTVAYDTSGNNRHANIIGATWVEV